MPRGELAPTLILHSLCCSSVCITLIMPDGETFPKLKQFSNQDAPLKKNTIARLYFGMLSFVPAVNLKNVLQMLVQIMNTWVGMGGRGGRELTNVKKRKGNCLPFSLPVTFPRSQELGWVLPFIEICPGSWTESDSRWARFKQFHCFIPWKLNNPASQSPVMSLGSHVLHCWDLSPVLVLATLPSSSESRHLCFWHPILQLLPWLLGLKLPVDDTCHPQSNVLPIWAFHYLGLLSFPGCVYPLEVLMSTVAWPMALLWAWHLSSCPAALALRLGLPSSLLSAVVWEVCARSCLIFSFHIVFLPYSDSYFKV